MTKLHNLRGQNLLRHNAIRSLIGNRATLISDSIDLYQLIGISLFNVHRKFVVHALELYSVSYSACLSEYKYRWSVVSSKKLLLLKSYFGYMVSILRVYLLRRLATSSGLLIISSEMRRRYLIEEGANFSIAVVRNKPIFDSTTNSNTIIRNKSVVVLIGNMYSAKEDFIKVVNSASLKNMEVHCYGVSPADEVWLRDMNFINVKIHNRVSQEGVVQILESSQYSLCLYSNVTVNNEYSSSSKVFELLYYGVIPIISKNVGLEFELNELGAKFIRIDEDFAAVDFCKNNQSLMYSEICHFSSELNPLRIFIDNFYSSLGGLKKSSIH